MQVRFTDNFLGNLHAIEDFWCENDFPQGYDSLLDILGDRVIPNLERYPEMGKPVSAHDCESIEAMNRIEKLAASYANIREYVLEDYLLVYLLADAVYLLAVKHHRQLAYDLAGLWLSR